ncbi:MAG TPA: hypothetical protein VF128_10145 [Gemmatimonadaceae bacterium]
MSAGRHLDRSILRTRLLVGIAVASVLVLASTWSALPWSPGASLYFFCLGASLEILGRRVRGFWEWAPIVIGVGIAIGNTVFRQETSSLAQDAHDVAEKMLSMVLGMAAGGVVVKDVTSATRGEVPSGD